MADVALSFAGITKEYRIGWRGLRVRALHNFACEVPSGQILGLLGANGSGKSTALKIAAGVVRPDQGHCRVFTHDAGTRRANQLIGFQPELGGVCAHLTALESLEYWGCLAGVDRASVTARAAKMLVQLDLESKSSQRVNTFSKGMKQRLAVGQALVAHPQLVLLDEPFSGLDPLAIRSLSDLLRALAQGGTTVVFTSHLLSKVEQFCDLVGLMHRGSLLACDTVDNVARTRNGARRSLDEVFIELVERPGGELQGGASPR